MSLAILHLVVCFSAAFKSSALGTFDDHAALLAAVRRSAATRGFYFFEIIVALAGAFKTFGTRVIAQFLGVERQVALSAAPCAFSRWQ